VRGHLRPDTLLTQSERVYSLALVSAGRGREALALSRRVVEDTRRLDAGDTQRVGDAEWGLAVALASVGALDEALPLMEHAVEHETSIGSDANLQILERLAWLGMMYAQAAMPVEANGTARRIDEIGAQVESVSMPIRLRGELTKAYAAAYVGDSERVRQLTQAVRNYPNVPETARLESLAIDTQDARWQDQRSRARQVALQLAEGIEASRLPGYRRAAYLSIAASALLAANDKVSAQRVLASAAEEYEKAGLGTSVQLSEFVYARARVGNDPTVRDDLQALVGSWKKVQPNSVWHGEALYWLSRVQEAEGQAEAAAQTRRLARPMLQDSKLPAMRLMAREN
jgi:hypothetical protein